MRLTTTCLTLLLAAFFGSPTLLGDTFGNGADQFTIDFVTIGNPGNRADRTGSPNPAGGVPYVYRMGTYEISRNMVQQANRQGQLGITLDSPAVPIFDPDDPATGVTWNEAARFVNFLNTSQGYPAAYKFSRQPGEPGYIANANIVLWQPGDPGYDETNRFRNSMAHYFLPSMDEWYKAAFYDPQKDGGVGGYWDYPTGSDDPPGALDRPWTGGTNAGSAIWNWPFPIGPAEITKAGGLSPYRTMGQAGNVSEWVETEFDGVNNNGLAERALRGGSWYWTHYNELGARYIGGGRNPSAEGDSYDIGFRIASIPEPSSALLTLVGVLGLIHRSRRSS
ncbi:MAG: SUMF1/EgtB/PvdO family nonheme iron enzyme [Pirellulales bacterium]